MVKEVSTIYNFIDLCFSGACISLPAVYPSFATVTNLVYILLQLLEFDDNQLIFTYV